MIKGLKVDLGTVQMRTRHNAEYGRKLVVRALRYLDDADRAERRRKAECRICFYVDTSRIVGHAITEAACGLCGQETTFQSTDVDALCYGCATDYALCRHCGADLEDREQRRSLKKVEGKS